jgi:hypothetical protein
LRSARHRAAPNQIDKRLVDWGAAGYQQRLTEAWRALGAVAGDWSTYVELGGLDAVSPAYQALLAGSANPREAFVVALWLHGACANPAVVRRGDVRNAAINAITAHD